MLFNIFCLWGRKFKISPNIKNFYQTYKNANEDFIREEILSLKHFDLEINRGRLAQKATAFNISVITFGISIASIMFGVFVQPAQKDYNTLIKSNSARIYVEPNQPKQSGTTTKPTTKPKPTKQSTATNSAGGLE